ncbi:MAG: putative NADH-quinone oxidoreductase subunit 2, partial [Ilumatobacteraceae bacterium]|nr:putative NADH-quinone oxidoreductase subunit 2 [Ilumatobacteraceae bacterium]
RRDPYRIVEGAAIAAFVVGAGTIYLVTKHAYGREVEALTRAAVELSGTGLLQELSINIVQGPSEYLLGEEKALLEVIEGREPLPRLLPPYLLGLFATEPAGGWEAESVALRERSSPNPTVVNNVETLASVTHILSNGVDWFRTMGTAASPGNILVTIVGDVVHPGVHEVPLGCPLDRVLDACGGPLPGRQFKAALSGVSNPVLPAQHFATPLTYEHFAALGTGLGAAGFVVYDDSVNMTVVAHAVSRFLSIESCGQCPPCKQGSLAITDRLADIINGNVRDAVLGDLEALLRSVTDANRCYVGTEEQAVVSSIMRTFPHDLTDFMEDRVVAPRIVDIPLIEDIDDDGTVTYDLSHRRKRPDWTYGPERDDRDDADDRDG